MKVILTQDLPEIKKKKGDVGILLHNYKFFYWVQFEDGVTEWIMPSTFSVINPHDETDMKKDYQEEKRRFAELLEKYPPEKPQTILDRVKSWFIK